MSDETALATVEQKRVEFYGDELTAVRNRDGKVYVSVTHLGNALELDRHGQVKPIQRHKIMREGYQRGVIMTPLCGGLAFEISAYCELPKQKYEQAMNWLKAGYQRLTNQDIPF